MENDAWSVALQFCPLFRKQLFCKRSSCGEHGGPFEDHSLHPDHRYRPCMLGRTTLERRRITSLHSRNNTVTAPAVDKKNFKSIHLNTSCHSFAASPGVACPLLSSPMSGNAPAINGPCPPSVTGHNGGEQKRGPP